jgi:hypothetical protein
MKSPNGFLLIVALSKFILSSSPASIFHPYPPPFSQPQSVCLLTYTTPTSGLLHMRPLSPLLHSPTSLPGHATVIIYVLEPLLN